MKEPSVKTAKRACGITFEKQNKSMKHCDWWNEGTDKFSKRIRPAGGYRK